MTQADMVLDYLERNGSITQDQADRELGIRRLAARIHDLARRGIAIDREMVEVRNRRDEVCTIARYTLAGGDDARKDASGLIEQGQSTTAGEGKLFDYPVAITNTNYGKANR